MRSIIFLLGFFIISTTAVKAQELGFQNNQEALRFYGDVMINALDADNRVKAAALFETLFEKELEEQGSFEKPLDPLKFVSVQYPEDKSFRIISWQVQESPARFTYKTYLQTNEGRLSKFYNDSNLSDDDLETTFTKNWPAHLIYKIKDTQTKDGKVYIVFGMKQIDEFNKVKVADVLTIENGSASFGVPIFVKNAESERPRKSNRIVMEYGADGNASLNYNPSLEMIVHDNVIPQSGMMPGQGVSYYPDGSYQAYKLESGLWSHIDKLYNTKMDEAPRPQPINNKSKGIFGKKKKSN